MHYGAPRRVAVVAPNRIPFARSNTAYFSLGNQAMLTDVLRGLVQKCQLQGELLGEVAGGAVMKHARDWNLVRECVLGSGLHPNTPAYDVQQACGTGLGTKLGLSNALGSIDRGRLNVKGSSIATGHPFAATGTRIVGTLAKILDQAGHGRGLISICAAGGQAVTAIMEK